MWQILWRPGTALMGVRGLQSGFIWKILQRKLVSKSQTLTWSKYGSHAPQFFYSITVKLNMKRDSWGSPGWRCGDVANTLTHGWWRKRVVCVSETAFMCQILRRKRRSISQTLSCSKYGSDAPQLFDGITVNLYMKPDSWGSPGWRCGCG